MGSERPYAGSLLAGCAAQAIPRVTDGHDCQDLYPALTPEPRCVNSGRGGAGELEGDPVNRRNESVPRRHVTGRARLRARALVLMATAAGALSAGGLAAAPASANLQHEFAIFANCPLNVPTVTQCVYSTTTGGEFHLGSKTVPVEGHTIVLQGGLQKTSPEVVPPTGGEELSHTPLQLPGGLVGIELLPPLTEVNVVAELAGPVDVSVPNALSRTGTAVALPIKAKLENPLLGGSCLIGSDSEPVSLALTTGTTNPPGPNAPISGSPGEPTLIAAGKIAFDKGTTLVDNSFSAPGVNGCGGPLLELVVDPSTDLVAGLPSASGKNTAILSGNLELAGARIVRTELALPEVGRCVKAPTAKEGKTIVHEGFYENTSCTFEDGFKLGPDEWESGPGASPGFTEESKAVTLETASKVKVKCLESHGSGEWTGVKTAKLGLSLTGCTLSSNKAACSSASAPSGEIELPGLSGQLGFIRDVSEAGELHVSVGLDLSRGGTFVEAECGGTKVAVSGSVIGTLPIDKMLGSFTNTFKQLAGKQEVEAFEEQSPDTLSATIGGGESQKAGLATSLKLINGEKLEIRGNTE
jgi:hypothetical protein